MTTDPGLVAVQPDSLDPKVTTRCPFLERAFDSVDRVHGKAVQTQGDELTGTA